MPGSATSPDSGARRFGYQGRGPRVRRSETRGAASLRSAARDGWSLEKLGCHPSLTLGEKRLPVRTEDHPIEYLDFQLLRILMATTASVRPWLGISPSAWEEASAGGYLRNLTEKASGGAFSSARCSWPLIRANLRKGYQKMRV
jgi:hypothetical protein